MRKRKVEFVGGVGGNSHIPRWTDEMGPEDIIALADESKRRAGEEIEGLRERFNRGEIDEGEFMKRHNLARRAIRQAKIDRDEAENDLGT